jgi:RNA polymerase sigma-70 factor (ECF subfamily)
MNTMDDDKIIELFWERSEDAIRETEAKYGRYMTSVASNILTDEQDRRECISDALLAAWNAIPPAKPPVLKLYLAKITRNLAVNKWRRLSAEKRRGGQTAAVFDELAELPDEKDPAQEVADSMALAQALSSFLRASGKIKRAVFIKRYWLFMPIKEIARSTGLSESNVKVMLHRMRSELRKHLAKEGFES